jgi:hypothetical protein
MQQPDRSSLSTDNFSFQTTMKKILIVCALVASPHAFSQTLRTVAAWETKFKNVSTMEYNTAHPQSTSNDSWQYYNLAYYIDANTAMFQATGNQIYLDRALLYISNMIASARPSSTLNSQFRDGYLGWVNHSHPSLGNDGKEYPLFESFNWRYVTTLLRIIKNSPKILNDPKYTGQYNSILSFTEKNIYEKWNARGANSYIYRQNTHMASHWARIGMDLWNITGNKRYLTVFDNFNHGMPNYGSSMRNQIRPHPLNPAAYWWSENWTGFSRPGQDVSHGNAVIATIVEAKESCLEYTAGDINALLKTFAIIWPASAPFPGYLDGSGSNGGWFNDGFVKLGRYDAALQRRLENHTIGQNTQLYGNGALNARILTAGRPVYPEIACSAVGKISVDSRKITTTAPIDGPNVAANVNDGNLSTRWSGFGDGQSITFDLGASHDLDHLKMAFFAAGGNRTHNFDVHVSANQATWTPVITNRTSAPGVTALQRFDFTKANARFVRITGHGNSDSKWNSYTEVEVWGR